MTIACRREQTELCLFHPLWPQRGFTGGEEASGAGCRNCKVSKWLDELQPATEVSLGAPNMNIHSFHCLGSYLLNIISLQLPKKMGTRGLHSPFYRKGN